MRLCPAMPRTSLSCHDRECIVLTTGVHGLTNIYAMLFSSGPPLLRSHRITSTSASVRCCMSTPRTARRAMLRRPGSPTTARLQLTTRTATAGSLQLQVQRTRVTMLCRLCGTWCYMGKMPTARSLASAPNWWCPTSFSVKLVALPRSKILEFLFLTS